MLTSVKKATLSTHPYMPFWSPAAEVEVKPLTFTQCIFHLELSGKHREIQEVLNILCGEGKADYSTQGDGNK